MMFPRLSEQALSSLTRHNQTWAERWANFQSHIPWPGKNAILAEQDEWRWTVESYLPFQEFRRSLASVFRSYLPAENWMPAPLHSIHVFLQDYSLSAMPAFLTEYWNILPAWLAGKVTYSSDDLLPLACSLADPPRFGTDSGRYPSQLQRFRSLLSHQDSSRPLTVLDIGCGIGLGTYELAAAAGNRPLTCLGLTPEPLEVWMAENRILPHDRRRQLHFPHAFFPGHTICFQIGTADHLPEGTYDFIFCNGLIGGRFFQSSEQFELFLRQCRQRMHSCSHLLVANNFHDGFMEGCRRFLHIARQNNWHLLSPSNDLRNIHLCP